MLGLSYKPHTDVCDGSQGVAIAVSLAAAGYEVHVFDPVATAPALRSGIAMAPSAEDCVRRADLVIVATDWPSFADIPTAAFRRVGRRLTLIDCWRQFTALADTVDLVQPGKAPSAFL